MPLLTFPESATPPALRAQVCALQREAWPEPDAGAGAGAGADQEEAPETGAGTGPTHDPALAPVSMLFVEGDTVVAALDVLSKEIVHAGRSYRAGGLSTVVTRPAARRRGHGRRLVAAARLRMAATGTDLGVFTCDRPLLDFYRSAGWHPLPGTVLVGGTPEAPFPSDQPGFDKVTVGAFFTERARRERSAFRYARVALHPGQIDKLW